MSMAFEEDVVLPAAHAQQNFAYQRYVMPVLGIDRDLRRRPERYLVAGSVVLDVDDGERPATFRPRAKIHERAGRLELAGCDRVQDEADLALEHATGHGIEGDLGLVSGLYPLQ